MPPLQFPELSRLDLGVNHLREIPSGLPDTLIALKLGFNSLDQFEMASVLLQDLNLSGNFLKEIDYNCLLVGLISLDISCNCLTELNDLSQKTPQLNTLIASHNVLKTFPKSLPLSIERVDVGFNDILEFDEPLLQYEHLTHLDLRGNKIVALPYLPATLDTLILNNSDADAVPLSPGQALKSFDFLCCPFRSLPDMRRCKLARSLRFISCGLTTCPTDLLPTSLRYVDLSSNKIRVINPTIFKLGDLRVLRLVANEITSVPSEIKNTSLWTFAIGQNPLAALPSLPKSLEAIDCCRCLFTELPPVFQKKTMRSIDFSCNQISRLSYVPRASELNFSMNLLTSLPRVPQECRIVDFSHNRLHVFQLEPQFTSVDVSHNDLIDLGFADERNGCPDLWVLKLSHNSNCLFPIDYQKFPRLTHIDLCDTHINHPFPIPHSFVDFVLASKEFFSLATGSAAKYFAEEVGYSETIGSRKDMEDALVVGHHGKMSFYAVIDGHGGCNAAHIIARYLQSAFDAVGFERFDDVHAVFRHIEQFMFQKKVSDGAVVALAMMQGDELGVAHLGDARVLLIRRNGDVACLTRDHKATDAREIELVKQRGTFVANGRLQGALAVARSMGDFAMNGVLHQADLTVVQLDQSAFRLIIGCDGVFDVLENDLVGRLAVEELDIHRAAALIKHVAVSRRSLDNVSVMVIDLDKRTASTGDDEPWNEDINDK
jgi:protein phosphatase